MLLLGPTDDLIAEDDADLAVGRAASDRLEPGFFGSLGFAGFYVGLELRHEEQQGSDRDRPQDQNREQNELVGSQSVHASQCRRA